MFRMATIERSPYGHTNGVCIALTDAVPTMASFGGVCKTDANDVFIFKETQAATEVTQQQIMTGRRARRSNKKYQSIRQRITRLHSLRHGQSADMALMTTQVSKKTKHKCLTVLFKHATQLRLDLLTHIQYYCSKLGSSNSCSLSATL